MRKMVAVTRAGLTSCLLCLVPVACGGGSTGGTDAPEDTLVDTDPNRTPDDMPDEGPDVELFGQVRDAVTDVGIGGVDVQLVRADATGDGATDSAVASTTTLADGGFAFGDVSRAENYVLAFESEGHHDELYTDIVLDAGGRTELDAVRLVSDDNAGTGGLAGLVSGADGLPLDGVRLDFRDGVHRRSGEVIASTRTAADGRYLVDGLGYGNVTATRGGAGVTASHVTFQVLGNVLTDGRDIEAVSAVGSGADTGTEAGADPGESPGDGALRIVLVWGERPFDLDAHLTGPEAGGHSHFHVHSGDRQADAVRLVEDATTGAGPETIEIDGLRAGVYRYSVFNFSGDVDRPLEGSAARVQVFAGTTPDGAPMAEFPVPAGSGNLWTVFDIDGGRIVPIGTVAPLRNVLDHFPPSARELARAAALAEGRSIPADDRPAESGGGFVTR